MWPHCRRFSVLVLGGLTILLPTLVGCGRDGKESRKTTVAEESSADVTWSAKPDPSPRSVNSATLLNSPIKLEKAATRINLPEVASPFVLVSLAGLDHAVYDLQSGEQVGKLDEAINLNGPKWSLSANGRYFAGPQIGRSEGSLAVWSTGTGDVVHTFPTRSKKEQFSSVDIGESRLFAVSFGDGLHGTAWDLESGRQVSDFRIADNGLCFAAAASPGGKYGVIIMKDHLVVHDLTSGQLVGKISHRLFPTGMTYQVAGPVFNSAGSLLAAQVAQSNGSDVPRVVVWDFQTGNEVAKITLPSREEMTSQWGAKIYGTRPLGSFRWSLDGGGWILHDQLLLDLASQEITALPKFSGLTQPLDQENSLLFVHRPDSSEYTLRRVDKTGPAGLADSTQKPSAEEIATSSAHQTANPPPFSSTEVQAGNPPGQLPQDQHEKVRSQPSTAEQPMNERNKTEHLEIRQVPWSAVPDPAPEKFEVNSQLVIPLPDSSSFEIYYPPRPSRFVFVYDSHQEKRLCYDLTTGKQTGEISGKLDTWFDDPVVSPDGKYWAVNFREPQHLLGIFSLESGKMSKQLTFREGRRLHIENVAFCSADQIVFGGRSGSVWDINQDRQLRSFGIQLPSGQHERSQSSATWSPGGSYAIGVGNLALSVHDLRTGKLAGWAPLPHPRSQGIYDALIQDGVAISPDGTRIAATYTLKKGTDWKYLAIWDFATGELLLSRAYDHFRWVDSRWEAKYDGTVLTWTPDNSSLLYRGHVLLDSATGTPVWVFPETLNQDRRMLGLDKMLVPVRGSGSKNELRVIPLEKSKLVAAIREARSSIGENKPPLAPSDFTSVQVIEPHSDPVAWAVTLDPAPIPETAGQSRIKLTSPSLPEQIVFSSPSSGKAVTQYFTRQEHAGSTVAGPVPPLLETKLTVLDLVSGKQEKELPLPSRDMLLDVSPDGSLILTGDLESLIVKYFKQLNVWAPHLLQPHAIGWRPTNSVAPPVDEMIDGAVFIDKRHVLTHATRRITLWKLPDCKAVYTIPDAGVIRGFSPNRKYMVAFQRDRGVELRESLTGKLAGRLAVPQANHFHDLRGVAFQPDGRILTILLGRFGSRQVLTYDVAAGQLREEFGIPEVTNQVWPSFQWLDGRYILLDGAYLIDTQNKAVVWHYEKHPSRVVETRGALGEKYWFGESALSAGTFGHWLRGVKLPIESPPTIKYEEIALLRPGLAVSLDVGSDVPEAPAVRQALGDQLTSFGLKVEDGAPLKCVFRVQLATSKYPEGLEYQLAVVDLSGAIIWERQSYVSQLREGSMPDMVGRLLVPIYVFDKDWKTKIGSSYLAAGN